ncbi:hydroxyisourate hydrolase [Microbulbifer aggregans]|uniref:hydroxyisourate hydrolase n=1 Tax=Microbulbifer aggregans TaxID=1769779 RepID=UPI001CFC5D07|nr:hydroxyisourate hydrolase [Microbulbifer aggregans]
MQKAPITTHVLDLHQGQPAAGIIVELYCADEPIAVAKTDSDGRIQKWDNTFELISEHWTLVFRLLPWFKQRGEECFFPTATLEFSISDCTRHYHLPLLLSQYGYTTYRGS